MIIYAVWFVLGAVACVPLVLFAQRISDTAARNLMGLSLIIAAVIYVLFALFNGDKLWVAIEAVGIVIYGSFYLLPFFRTLLWVGIGWLLHPFWDVGLHLMGPGSHIAPSWYAILCLSFDFVAGGYLIRRHFLGSASGTPHPG